MAVKVEMQIPDPVPPPPVEFIIRHTEGQGSWKLTEAEARQLCTELELRLAELVMIRRRRSGRVED